MKHDNDAIIQPALSYPLEVRLLPVKGVRVHLDTDEKERAQLAENHGLHSVISFNADFLVSQWKKRGVKIKGYVRAEIIQECVITLESVPDSIEEEVEVVMVPSDSRLAKPKLHEETGELFLDAEGPDMPEVFEGDKIDIGMLAEEFFELAINPYPRKPGVELKASEDNLQEDEKKVRPFDVLKKLKDT